MIGPTSVEFASPLRKRTGRVITFYSYKGGVGRSFALANVAVLLARRGWRVLLVDFDLEAPGLDRYFRHLAFPNGAPARGLLHLLHESVHTPKADWRSYISRVPLAPTAGHSNPLALRADAAIDLLPSGSGDASYASLLQSFSWDRFFSDNNGAETLERWRREWRGSQSEGIAATYDFVLLDSRTGLTDAGGVCTILLPDFLVLCFTTGRQSLDGAKAIARSAQVARQSLPVPRSRLTFLPILCRFDAKDEFDLSQQWLDSISDELAFCYANWLPDRFMPRRVLEQTKVPYFTRFSFGEPLPVIDQGVTDPTSVGYVLDNVARLLASDFEEVIAILEPNVVPPETPILRLRTALTRPAIDEKEIGDLLMESEQKYGISIDFAELLLAAGVALLNQDHLSMAEPLLRRAVELFEKHAGVEDPRVATVLAALGRHLHRAGELGRGNESLEPIQEAVYIHRRLAGDNPDAYLPNLAESLYNLANRLSELGRREDAVEPMREAVDIYRKLAAGNPDAYLPKLAASMNNLATTLKAQGDLVGARKLEEQVLETWIRLLGMDHPDTLKAMSNLAETLYGQGDLAGTRKLQEQVLEARDRLLGKDHPDTLKAINNLATTLKAQGDLAGARKLQEQVLEARDRLLGKDHPDTLKAINNLAGTLYGQGDLAGARKLQEQALEGLERLLGREHPDTLRAMSNLAQTLSAQGDFAEARQLQDRVLETRNRLLGREHPDTLRAMNNLAQTLSAQGDLTGARQLQDQVLEVSRHLFGEEPSG
jgi:tetratricopeptide (TPR) repeat protein/cellulose biosynthesis protein BcsQ